MAPLLVGALTTACSSQAPEHGSHGPGDLSDAAGLADGGAADAAAGEAGPVEDGAVNAADGTTAKSDASSDAAAPDAPTSEGDASVDGSGSASDAADEPYNPQPPACSIPCTHGTCIPSSGTCACDADWGGAHCDTAAPALDPASTESSSVAPGAWLYFSYRTTASGLSATLMETGSVGQIGLFLSAGQVPTQASNLDSDENSQSASHSVAYTFAAPGTQTWYVGVYGEPATGGGAGPYPFNLNIAVVP